MAFGKIEIEHTTRFCEVDGVVGYFHLWEQYSQPIGASPFVGGSPAGVVSRVYGIVEFPDGVKHIEPSKIIFADEDHASLVKLNEIRKEKENGRETL